MKNDSEKVATQLPKRNSSSKNQTASKNNPANEAGFCVYLGPTFMGVIQNGTVIRGTKEEAMAALNTAIAKYPLIATMIVPGDTLVEDRIKVKTPGNWLYVNYHRLLAGNKLGGKL